MAFTFSTTAAAVGTNTTAYTQDDPITGVYTLSATTDTSSAAGTFYCPFTPRYIVVYQQTTPAVYEWFTGMTAAYMKKTVAAGTVTTETSNGITVANTTDATAGNGPVAVILGTGCHTNSATFRITCFK
jgi:hypothetical protein